MQKIDNKKIIRKFGLRQSRQLLAIAVTMLLLLFLTFIYKRPDLFGEISKNNIFEAQILIIAMFVGFSAMNWRCPSCNKYLGNNIFRKQCKKCGTRLR